MQNNSQLPIEELIEKVTGEIVFCAGQVSPTALSEAGTLIEDAPRIFVSGAGRSGLCMRAFCMRLMHLGFTAFFVGETSTPSIGPGDLLILGSGSGRTTSLTGMSERAKKIGAKLLLITAAPQSPLARLSDHVVHIPAPLPNVSDPAARPTIQPLATLFEQTLLIICDTLILELMNSKEITTEKMGERHANLE